MLKTVIKNEQTNLISNIFLLPDRAIKSRNYYPGFNNWLENKFIPNVGIDRDILSCHDKKYDTLLGFTLVKFGKENKICNLSPLVDGVGITQVLLDTAHFYFNNDYVIDVPITNETTCLHSKLKQLGFEITSFNNSCDSTNQITYSKIKNIGWI